MHSPRSEQSDQTHRDWRVRANAGAIPGIFFYATDDPIVTEVIEQLISAAGFDSVKAGGVAEAMKIEVFGALQRYGGFDGTLSEGSAGS